jgi:XTP/dITP diphosphohydrolase
MRQIVLASNNTAKLKELRALLVGLPFEIVNQAELGVPVADETGLTFVENAILKARHATAHTGLSAIADDSGLEVGALNGTPGVFSARYAGPDASDAANNAKLLAALADVPETERSARFVCAAVFLRHAADPVPIICMGAWPGRILREPRGAGGFGYDPIFYVPTQDRAAAELPAAVKNRISHRGRALRRLARVVQRTLSPR